MTDRVDWLLVTGTRRNTRRGVISDYLDRVRPRHVVVGDCNLRHRFPEGVDAETVEWCRRTNTPCLVAIAVGEWPGAGPRRNLFIRACGIRLARDETIAWVGVPDDESKGTIQAMGAFMEWKIPGETI